jgi:NAD(P) transhydrogenase
VDYEEDGSGSGGYAKEMSDEYKLAEARCLAQWVAESDVVITTALIPGRPAPRLISEAMLTDMRSGSVVLDMAASDTGGNVALSAANEVVTLKNGVKIIGYTNLPSRLATTASNLFGNNMAKFILSVGPTTSEEHKGSFLIDYEDPAVRGMLVVDGGQLIWPNPQPYSPPPRVVKEVSIEPVVAKATGGAPTLLITGLSIALLLAGALSPDPAFTGLITVFALSSFAGQQVVWDVSPALHSPLMAVTNAVSFRELLNTIDDDFYFDDERVYVIDIWNNGPRRHCINRPTPSA